MKEELIVGAWYKSKHNDYFKFEKTENGWDYYSERIMDTIWDRVRQVVGAGFMGWRFGWVGFLLEDLTEIQPFLPANHPDLFTDKPIQNENLDYLIDLLKSNNIT